MALLEFTYDGSQKAIVANENCIVRYTLVGGGGGGGGPDTYAGCTGIAGKMVNGLIALNKGDKIYCAVGQGGRGGGGQGTSHPGGAGGNGLSGFSGGAGGYSGWSGSSGAGAGGGAATVLSFDPSGHDPIAIAPGGGGGGGGGNHGGAPLYPSDPYGDTSSYALQYFTNAATNGAYCSFLNTYGIWNGIEHNTWEVYFENTGTYTFRLSADNYAYIWLDNGTVNGNNDFIGVSPTDAGAVNFNEYRDFTHYVTKGWHTIDVYAKNWGGPASVGAAIIAPNSTSYMWTTRSAYNPLSSTLNRGRGGHGVDYRGDGGGAGGGGGGINGGRGGSTRSGDVGGWSGSSGYEYNLYPINDYIGTPGSYGAGGIAYARPTGGYPGGDGYAVFEAIHTDVTIKNSLWKRAIGIYVRRSLNIFGWTIRYWSKLPAVYVRDNSSWKKVYGDMDLSYYTTTSAYNNTSGPYPG